MPRTRVLIVDDVAVIRRFLTTLIAEDPDMEVVGTAPNGDIGLDKISVNHPDVVILDIEMPGMGGLETLKRVRELYPELPVVIFSSLTERGAGVTIDALMLGASDYVTKPTNLGSAEAAREHVRGSLLPKLKGLAPKKSIQLPPGAGPVAVAMPVCSPLESRPQRRVDVLAIGASTGGPNALVALLADLPKDFPVPILIVQHMPPIFTRALAERLTQKTNLQFSECGSPELLTPGRGWIAPGGEHMTVCRKSGAVCVRTNLDPPENYCRPSVDVLFRSVAACFGPHSLGLVMTGMGHDGCRGSEEIRLAGGSILVQDEATSVVWGMGGAVAQAGLADRILPLPALAGEILARANVGRMAGAAWAPLLGEGVTAEC